MSEINLSIKVDAKTGEVAVDGFVKKLKEGDQAAKSAKSSFDGLWKQFSVGALAANAASRAIGLVTNGLAEAVGASMRYERTLKQIETLTGAGVEQTKEWSKALVDLGGVVGKGPEELAKAMLFVASAGQTGAAALSIVENAAKGSAVGMGETAQIARAVTSAMNAYGESNLNAKQAMDVLTQAVIEGGAEAHEYAGTLGRVLSVAASAGVTFQEVGAFMAVFTRQGVSADEAATALRGTISALISPSKEATDALGRFGITSEQLRASISERGLQKTLADLIELTGGNVEKLSEIIPEMRALAGVLGVATTQGDEYAAVLGRINDSHGALDKAFEETSDTLSFQWDRLTAKASGFAETIIGKVIPAVTGLLKILGDVADEMGNNPMTSPTAGARPGLATAKADPTGRSSLLAMLFGVKPPAPPRQLPGLGGRAGEPDAFDPFAGVLGGGGGSSFVMKGVRTASSGRLGGGPAIETAEQAKERIAKQKRAEQELWDFRLATWKLGQSEQEKFYSEQERVATANSKKLLANVEAEAKAREDAEERMMQAMNDKAELDESIMRAAQERRMEELLSIDELGFALQELGDASGGALGAILSLGGGALRVFTALEFRATTTAQKIQAAAGAVQTAAGILAGPGGAKGALGGAVAGATAGAAFGPLGAVAGGLIGGVLGLFGGGDKKKREEERKKQEEEKRKAEEERVKLRTEGRSEMAAGAIRAISSMAPTTEKSAREQASLFSIAFWETFKEEGLLAAVDAFQETFAKLQSSGFDVSAALGPVASVMTAATNDLFRGAAEAAQGWAQFIGGAIKAEVPLAVDQLTALGGQARSAFDQAREGALSAGLGEAEATKAAFAAVAPLLQQVLAASEVYGTTIDENTQALIDQAKAAGIAFPTDPMNAMVKLLEQIVTLLGGEIPAAAARAGAAIGGIPAPPGPPEHGSMDHGGFDPSDDLVSAASGYGPRRLGRDTMFMAHKGEHVLIVPAGKPVGFLSAAGGHGERIGDPERERGGVPGGVSGGGEGPGDSGAGAGTGGRPGGGGSLSDALAISQAESSATREELREVRRAIAELKEQKASIVNVQIAPAISIDQSPLKTLQAQQELNVFTVKGVTQALLDLEPELTDAVRFAAGQR